MRLSSVSLFENIENQMGKIRRLNLFSQCRLCGIYGPHKKDIFDEKSRIGDNLSEKIFKCVGVQVSKFVAIFSGALKLLISF